MEITVKEFVDLLLKAYDDGNDEGYAEGSAEGPEDRKIMVDKLDGTSEKIVTKGG